MAEVTISKEFNVNSEKLWEQVRQFNNMERFLPSLVTSCSLDGRGQGSKRVCGTENGDIIETLTLLDEANKTLEYTIDNEDAPLPLANYTGKVTVERLGDNKTQFTWSGKFEPKGMPESEVVLMMEGVFISLLDNIAGSTS